MSTLLWILVFGFFMSCIALVGSLTTVFPPHFLVEKTVLALVAFAAGSLWGGAVFHMIPASVDKMGNETELYVWLTAGFVLFLALEQFLNWHHSHTHSHHYNSPCRRPGSPQAGSDNWGERESSIRTRTDVFPIRAMSSIHTDAVQVETDGAAPPTGDDEAPPPRAQNSDGLEPSSHAEAPNDTNVNEGDGTRHPSSPQQHPSKEPLTYLILLADALHNFIGGLFVGASFVDSVSLGLSAWLAAAAHEVPQELGDFAILLHGGWDKKSALSWNFVSALTFPLGGIIAYLTSQRMDVSFLIPFAAGNFLYVGATDLIPEIKHYHGVRTNLLYFSSFVLGITILLVIRIVVDGW